MEGLLLAEILNELEPLLPTERFSWRFLDAQTYILPLAAGPSLWLLNRPPNPRLELRNDLPPSGKSFSGFQDQVLARAAGGLVRAEQSLLDRVVTFEFGAGGGFVESEPMALVFELTGRNCNLILTRNGIVLGAARRVGADINRYRQIRAGGRYQPPPPYTKLDPRFATAPELRRALEGEAVRKLRSVIDGIGPVLTKTLGVMLGPEIGGEEPLAGEMLDRAVAALEALVAAPSRVVADTIGLPDLARLREQERRAKLRDEVRKLLVREQRLVEKRLHDADRTVAAAQTADQLRRRAELLMAYPQKVPANQHTVHLEAFDGKLLEIELDPALDAIANAQRLYAQAKKREQRALAAAERKDLVAPRLIELDSLVAGLESADDGELTSLLERFGADRSGGRPKTKVVGLRFRDPRGLEIVIGRSVKENDAITFRLARSLDVWLHVQAFAGSHVLIRADGREVPFDTILFAARLAAGHSKAAQGDNVAVDYTHKKNVWRIKGMAPGAVHISHQKTVYVTPMRRPPAGPEALGG